MLAIRGHFDGKVIVPDEPVDLPTGRALIVHVEPAPEADGSDARSVLEWMVENPIVEPALPADLSHQHDHYLYGTAKRNEGE